MGGERHSWEPILAHEPLHEKRVPDLAHKPVMFWTLANRLCLIQ